MGKITIGLTIQELEAYAQTLQQLGEDDAAYAIDAIHTYRETGLTNHIGINQRESQHAVDVTLVKTVVFDIFTQMINIGILEIFTLGNSENLCAIGRCQEFTLAIKQLQSVPLTRVMGCGDNDTAVGSTHANSQFGSWCGSKSDVQHIIAHTHQSTTYNVLHHLA